MSRQSRGLEMFEMLKYLLCASEVSLRLLWSEPHKKAGRRAQANTRTAQDHQHQRRHVVHHRRHGEEAGSSQGAYFAVNVHMHKHMRARTHDFEHSRLQRQRDSEIISDEDYTDGKQFIIKEAIELYETAKRRHLEPEMSSPATPLRSPSSAASEGTPSPALPPRRNENLPSFFAAMQAAGALSARRSMLGSCRVLQVPQFHRVRPRSLGRLQRAHGHEPSRCHLAHTPMQYVRVCLCVDVFVCICAQTCARVSTCAYVRAGMCMRMACVATCP